MSKINILLADDHTMVRKGLRSLLEREAGINVVDEAEDGREAMKKAEALQPDIVVMDIAMPGLSGLEATRQLKKRFPEMKFIILTVHDNEEYVLQTLRAGASGYLVKKAAPAELISAIRAVFKGDSYLSPSISRTVIDEYIRKNGEILEKDYLYEQLTNREREVLQLIAEGKNNREVAELLGVSIKTIETHKAHIMAKLSVRSVAELTQYAIQKGIIVLD